MNQLFMLDTNIVSYIVKGRSPACREQLYRLGQDDLACISSVTEAELRYGLAKTPAAHALRSLIDRFLAEIQVKPWGRNEAQAYGQVRARLEQDGMSLANLDLMIAAHAVSTNAVLVTNDRAFAQVRALYGIVNWATDV